MCVYACVYVVYVTKGRSVDNAPVMLMLPWLVKEATCTWAHPHLYTVCPAPNTALQANTVNTCLVDDVRILYICVCFSKSPRSDLQFCKGLNEPFNALSNWGQYYEHILQSRLTVLSCTFREYFHQSKRFKAIKMCGSSHSDFLLLAQHTVKINL